MQIFFAHLRVKAIRTAGATADWQNLLTKKLKSAILRRLWDTKFDRGSMQIFFAHLRVKAIRTAGATADWQRLLPY